MSVQERIKQYCKAKGLSIRQFEINCKMSNGYVSSMRKGLGLKKLEQVLIAYPDLNREWLLYGEGEMTKKTPVLLDLQNRGLEIPIYICNDKYPLHSILKGEIEPVNYLHIPGVSAQGAIQVPTRLGHPPFWNDYYLFEASEIPKIIPGNDNYVVSYYDKEGHLSTDLFHFDFNVGGKRQRMTLIRSGGGISIEPAIEIEEKSITAIALIKARVRVAIQKEPWLY